MFKRVSISLLVAIAILFGLALLKPNEFRVERSIVINAPADRVFALIQDFNGWRQWSPWDAKDPAMKRELGAITSGVGASYAWDGNAAVGKGNMQIVEAEAPGKVRIDLNFEKPMAARNVAEFVLSPEGAGTRVTWTMSGPMPFMSKVMSVFMSMDAMVGPDFEAGLAAMKKAAEQG